MVKKIIQPTSIERIVRSVGSVPSLLIHTVVFISSFFLSIFGIVSWGFMLLILTTVLSLEAIYLAIFIQMTVNKQTESLREVEEDIDEIQEDVEDMSADVEDIQEDIEELGEEEVAVEEIAHPHAVTLETLTAHLQTVLAELETLKQKH